MFYKRFTGCGLDVCCVQESDAVESSRSASQRPRGANSAAAPTQPPPPPPQPAPVITLQYFGSHLDLSHRWLDRRDEVIIEQQPSGGNTVYVYRDRLSPGGARQRLPCALFGSLAVLGPRVGHTMDVVLS